jgi:hypothetical protein
MRGDRQQDRETFPSKPFQPWITSQRILQMRERAIFPCVFVRNARFHPHFASHCDCVPETGDPLGIALPEGHRSHRLMLPPVTDVVEYHVLRLPVKMAVFTNRVSPYLLSIPPRPFPPQTSPRAV